MQMKPERQTTDATQPHDAENFPKLWSWFYLITTVFILGLLFLWYQIVVDYVATVNPSRFGQIQSLTLGLGMLMIVIAIILKINENYSVEISAQGVSKKVWGKQLFIGWDQIENINWDRGITLVSSSNSLYINPAIFKQSSSVYEFVEKQWCEAKNPK